MKWLQRALAVLASIFGSVGVFACVVGLAGVWVLDHRLQAGLGGLLEEVTHLTGRVETRATEAADQVESSRESVREIETRVQQWVQDALELSPEDVRRLADLRRELGATIQRVTDWVAFAQATVDFIGHVLDTASATFGFFNAEPAERMRLTQAVDTGLAEVEKAVGLFDEIEVRLDAVRAGDRVGDAAGFKKLSDRIDESLAALKEQVVAFAFDVSGLGARLDVLKQRVNRTIRIVTLVLSCLLVWQVAAQVALAHYGWKSLRPLTSRKQHE